MWIPGGRTILRIEFQTQPGGTIEQLSEHISGHNSIELDNAFYVEDGKWIEFLTISSENTVDFGAIIEGITGAVLTHAREIPSGPSPDAIHRLILLALEPYPFILSVVLRHEAIPNRIILRDNHFHVVVTVQNWDQFQSLADEIQDKMRKFELLSVNQIDRPGEPLGTGQISEILTTKLTDKQIRTLETAYNLGYFEVPRNATATDVSEKLEIAQSTFSERLRNAENNLFELIFGDK